MTSPAIESTTVSGPMPVHAGALPRGVTAVVVTHSPDVPLLREVLEAVRPQVDGVVVVDNATQGVDFDRLLDDAAASGCEVIRNLANLGLAAGFNLGIARAREQGSAFVLLLDQDSVASPGMVATLLDAYASLSKSGRVAAVGAQFVDPRDGRLAPFVRVGFPFNRKLHGAAGECIESDFLISSGSLLPLPVIDDVGGMDEGLFIDSVDLDWCFRARAAGYQLHGVCDARMRHSIGDALKPSLLGHKIFVHSPRRLYYLTRNRLLLYRRAHTPRVWIAQDLLRVVGKFLRMSLLVAPRGDNARAMLRGIRDGIRGRTGTLRP